MIRSMLLALCLTGCAGQVRTVRVEVPVSVPCTIVRPAEPVWQLDVVPVDADPFQTLRAALIEVEQRRAYIGLQDAAIAACQ